MVRFSSKLLLIGAGTMLLSACATRQPDPQPPAPRPPARAPSVAPRAPAAADYFSRAASIDLFLIQASELALSKPANPRTQQLARHMIQAHRGTSGQLALAGRRLNLLPARVLQPAEQRMMDALAAHPQFDRLYWRDLVTLHEMAIDLHSNYAQWGASPTLKPVAAAAVPVYRRHLDELRRLR